ncbi:MAG: helix-turn-helix domain-containing protein [Chitinispirillaceae bacterium]|jgi:biotin operon repressor|nr:helix-turn-helix domain-containing protein [Chitinispirillaceae bacterium]
MARISKGQLEKLRKKYATDEAIGSLYGISRQAVHQLRVRYGFPPIDSNFTKRNEEIVRLYRDGISGNRLAKKYRLSRTQTYRIIRGGSERCDGET